MLASEERSRLDWRFSYAAFISRLSCFLGGREWEPPRVQREDWLPSARGLPSSINAGPLASVKNFKGHRTVSIFITVLIITNAETSVDSLILCIIFGCAGSLLVRGFFSSCGEQELLFSCGGWACHRGGFSFCRAWALTAACGLSSCVVWAWLLYGMWDLPGPGIEAVFPALAGRFFTTEPPGKPN